MKKVKNTEVKSSDSSLKTVKSNIKKKTPKNVKKLKEAVAKTEDLDLAPKIEIPKPNNGVGADKKLKKQQKKKLKKQQKKLIKKQHKNLESAAQTNATTGTGPKTNEQKIEKKDSKSSPKANGQKKSVKSNKPAGSSPKTNGQKIEKKAKSNKSAATKVDSTNEVKDSTNEEKLNKPATTNLDSTSSKVLAKKEKKLQKRKLIKEQKLAEKQTRDPALEAATVFVGNLPVNTKRVQLIRLFKSFGPVNSIRLRSAGGLVLHKHKQRKSAGALNAYVVLKSKETAEKAVSSLNGTEFKENHLRVTMAAKNPQNHEKEQIKRTVFVGNLKYSANEESLREIFSSCGEIDYVRCLREGDKGCKGVAFVCFKTPDAVGLALELNKTIVDDRPINVERGKLEIKPVKKDGAKQRIYAKKGNKGKPPGNKGKPGNNKGKPLPKKPNNASGGEAKQPKKSEFRGVKVEGLKKKKPLAKKKKSNDQQLKLAKKIAPKPKTE